MKHILKTTLVICTLAAIPASAQDKMVEDTFNPNQPSRWAVMNYTWTLLGQQTNQVGTRMKKSKIEPKVMEIAYVKNTDSRARVALNCTVNQMQLAVTLGGEEGWRAYEEIMFLRNTRNRKVNVYVNGTLQDPSKWGYFKRTKSLYAMNTMQTKLLYNNIIRGDKVEIEHKGERYDLTLPEPNQSFANWGAKCGVGLKKDRVPKIAAPRESIARGHEEAPGLPKGLTQK